MIIAIINIKLSKWGDKYDMINVYEVIWIYCVNLVFVDFIYPFFLARVLLPTAVSWGLVRWKDSIDFISPQSFGDDYYEAYLYFSFIIFF